MTNFRIALEELLRPSRSALNGTNAQQNAAPIEMATVNASGTRGGSVDLQIPKLRKRSYMPSLLEPRRRA